MDYLDQREESARKVIRVYLDNQATMAPMVDPDHRAQLVNEDLLVKRVILVCLVCLALREKRAATDPQAQPVLTDSQDQREIEAFQAPKD